MQTGLNCAQWKAVNTVIKLRISCKDGSRMPALKEDPVDLNFLVTECTAAEPMSHVGFGS